MAQQLLIRIVSSEHIDYLLQDDKQGIISSGSAFHPDQRPEFPINAKATVIVPGENVLIFELTLPRTHRAQLLKAVPFALEEQLIENIETLHFVVGKQRANGNVTIAVVKKELMTRWLAQCQQLQVQPICIIPDYAAVPLLENNWHVYLDGGRALLRLSAHQGMSIDLEQLQSMLQLSIAERPMALPAQVLLDYDDGNEHFEIEALSNLSVPIEMAVAHTYCMELFLHGLKTAMDINLLQGDFVVTKRQNKNTLLWRVVGGLAIAWLAVWLVGSLIQYFVYHSRLKQANTQVAALYHQAYPNAQSVVSPQARITQSLAAAQTLQSGGHFLSMLTQVAQQLNHVSGVSITSFTYRDNNLTLAVNAPAFDLLTSFTQALQQQGLQVQQQNAQSQGNMVTAQLIISVKKS